MDTYIKEGKKTFKRYTFWSYFLAVSGGISMWSCPPVACVLAYASGICAYIAYCHRIFKEA